MTSPNFNQAAQPPPVLTSPKIIPEEGKVDALLPEAANDKGVGVSQHVDPASTASESIDSIVDGAPPRQTTTSPEPGAVKTEIGSDTNAPQVVAGGDHHKPEIYTGAGQAQDNLAAAEELLAATGRYFIRHGTLVTVLKDESTAELVVRNATKHQLFPELDGAAVWLKQGRGGWVPAHPPDRVCTGMLQHRAHAHLQSINSVARQPFYRPDGSLVTTPGYDKATGTYAHFDEKAFVIPTEPTQDQVDDALAMLEGALADFPFATDLDKSAALAAMLTAAMRPSLDAAPLFHVRAHQAGTGKSYLCRVITALATPTAAKAAVFPGSDTECGKVVLAALRDNPEVIEFDNLTGDLVPHQSLCSTLTAEMFCGRMLGHSEMKTVSTRTLFLSSGNNVGPVEDMARRCITINLDAGVELPAARVFKNPVLNEQVLAKRGKFVSAALTIVQAWIRAGRPDGGVPPIASFGQWSSLCRLPLIWAGKPDPAEAMFAAMKEDPMRTLIGRVLVCLHSLFGSHGAQVRDMLKVANDPKRPESAELLELLQDITQGNVVNKHRLGRWLARHVGHVVGGLRLARSTATRSAVVWIVEAV